MSTNYFKCDEHFQDIIARFVTKWADNVEFKRKNAAILCFENHNISQKKTD